ncbi:MAG: hypothetical protein FWC70_08925 [Defluviitaleaceae bacterium]|nr:hypothetical protein [Defluviitaleaceae bacterium]
MSEIMDALLMIAPKKQVLELSENIEKNFNAVEKIELTQTQRICLIAYYKQQKNIWHYRMVAFSFMLVFYFASVASYFADGRTRIMIFLILPTLITLMLTYFSYSNKRTNAGFIDALTASPSSVVERCLIDIDSFLRLDVDIKKMETSLCDAQRNVQIIRITGRKTYEYYFLCDFKDIVRNKFE